ncbi:major facilitator superfamily protein [Striga asiatica]|uniref:Major facilitator superfamily protein n=1 Tax=Striga asiatica TaxID=4170 RepID=A0A5A7RFE8_STRAF|nr:major facilitator superfamily protein [Striga asiatica]
MDVGLEDRMLSLDSVTDEFLRAASAVGSVVEEKTGSLGGLLLTRHLAGISVADDEANMFVSQDRTRLRSLSGQNPAFVYHDYGPTDWMRPAMNSAQILLSVD